MPKDKKRYFRNLIQERKQKYSESVLQYIIDIRSLCYQMDDEMSESDIIDHLFDGLLPSFKREFEMNKCQTIDEFTEFARKIDRQIVITLLERLRTNRKLNSMKSCKH